jgi:uncharacterized protein YecE (DUF72 family)
MTDILLGTSAFTAKGWVGSFYPAGTQPRDFPSYYATQINVIELDNTFYRTPAISTVEGWNMKTPPQFHQPANLDRPSFTGTFHQETLT